MGICVRPHPREHQTQPPPGQHSHLVWKRPITPLTFHALNRIQGTPSSSMGRRRFFQTHPVLGTRTIKLLSSGVEIVRMACPRSRGRSGDQQPRINRKRCLRSRPLLPTPPDERSRLDRTNPRVSDACFGSVYLEQSRSLLIEYTSDVEPFVDVRTTGALRIMKGSSCS